LEHQKTEEFFRTAGFKVKVIQRPAGGDFQGDHCGYFRFGKCDPGERTRRGSTVGEANENQIIQKT
jgi:hypothetical protein